MELNYESTLDYYYYLIETIITNDIKFRDRICNQIKKAIDKNFEYYDKVRDVFSIELVTIFEKISVDININNAIIMLIKYLKCNYSPYIERGEREEEEKLSLVIEIPLSHVKNGIILHQINLANLKSIGNEFQKEAYIKRFGKYFKKFFPRNLEYDERLRAIVIKYDEKMFT